MFRLSFFAPDIFLKNTRRKRSFEIPACFKKVQIYFITRGGLKQYLKFKKIAA